MLLGAGCANKKRSLEVPFKPAPVVKREPPAESFYTPDRQLVGSPVRVEWLEIPLAFRPTGQDFGRHHLFEARAVGLQVARDFFSQRMLSGMAEETPGSVFYGAVMPPSGGDAVRLHVRLTQRPLAGVLELDVESLRGDDTKPLSVEEARRALAAEQKHAH
jgi:hypothetical protein